jgi:minor histocompatibility antigen H13
MSSEDAWKFPLYGSAILFGLYQLFKFSKDWINLIMTGYFLFLGVVAVEGVVTNFLKYLNLKLSNEKITIAFPMGTKLIA